MGYVHLDGCFLGRLVADLLIVHPVQDTFVAEGDFSPETPNGVNETLEVGRFSIFSDLRKLWFNSISGRFLLVRL